jgi:hypothetical protein
MAITTIIPGSSSLIDQGWKKYLFDVFLAKNLNQTFEK